MFKFKGRIAVIDCETGGLPNKNQSAFDQVALTEIAVVIIDTETLEIVDKGGWLVKPYKDDLVYDPRAAEATGIDKARCEAEGLPINEVFKNFNDIIMRNKVGRAKPRFAGHNTGFDLPFVENFYKYHKKDISKFIETNITIDTLIFAHYAFPTSPNHKLGTICTLAGVDLTNAHRALDDTIATAELTIHFFKGLRGLNSKSTEESTTTEEQFKFNF